MLEITEHTKVFTAHDEYVGRVDRIVMDPITTMVSHIVVRKGVLFPEDKVIPVENISTATEERINLARGSHPDEFPSFIEEHYVEVDEPGQDGQPDVGSGIAPFVWYGPYGVAPALFESSMRLVVEKHIPERAVALKAGVRVCNVGRVEVGRLDEVITTDAGMATHIVINLTNSTLGRKALPVSWIDAICEDEIHLGATQWMIDAVDVYDPHVSPIRD